MTTNGTTSDDEWQTNDQKWQCVTANDSEWYNEWKRMRASKIDTAWKVSKYGAFSGPYFPVFSLNTGKYGLGKTPYLGTFHAVRVILSFKRPSGF